MVKIAFPKKALRACCQLFVLSQTSGSEVSKLSNSEKFVNIDLYDWCEG
jgi:hypothetical protein